MIVAIKIAGADQVGDPIPSHVVEQQSAQHGLLCLDRMRWGTDVRKLWIREWRIHPFTGKNTRTLMGSSARPAFGGYAVSPRTETVISATTSECNATDSL